MPLILVNGGGSLVVLLRHQGIVGIVEVREIFFSGFLFDGDGFAFDAFDTVNFCFDETACSGGFGILAGDAVGWGQLTHQFEAVLAAVHGGAANGGGVARGGKDASCFTRARF